MLVDTTASHRYAPLQVITLKGMRPVLRYVAHPPCTHPGSPIRPTLTAVELQTNQGSRWYGCDRAYIAADLGMVLVGWNESEERSAWHKVPASLQQGGAS